MNFTFRLNEGSCKRDTQDRHDDLFKAMDGKTVTYRELTAWKRNPALRCSN